MNEKKEPPELVDIEFSRTGESDLEIDSKNAEVKQDLKNLEQISDELKTGFTPEISAETDLKILALIHEKSGQIQAQNSINSIKFPGLKKIARIAALFLISFIALWIVYLNMANPQSQKLAPETVLLDHNQDGQINVIDAYLLARNEQNPDTSEVQELMSEIVSLKGKI